MRTAETVFVDGTTFFNKPKEELLRKVVSELEEFMFVAISDAIDVPQELKGRLKYEATDPTRLGLWAEQALKRRYRLPTDITAEQIVPPEERSYIMQCIGRVDSFSRQKAAKSYRLWCGKEFRAGGITLEDNDVNDNLAIVLNSHNRLQPWYLTFSLIINFPNARNTNHWKHTQKSFQLYRNQDGHVISYSIENEGLWKPRTPWNYMVKDDCPTIYETIRRTENLIRKDRDGNIKCYVY